VAVDKTFRVYDQDQSFLMPPSLRDWLATAATDADAPPESVQRWLVADGWQLTPELLCPDHRT